MPRIKLGEVNMDYVEAGEGEAFLFAPGLIGPAKAWEFQFPHSSGRYRCVSFGHCGSGKSDKAESGYTTAPIAADAVAPAHRDRNVAANCMKHFFRDVTRITSAAPFQSKKVSRKKLAILCFSSHVFRAACVPFHWFSPLSHRY